MNENESKLPSYVFFGTPRFAARALDELASAGFMPELIVTAPDKPAGRGLEMTPPAVKEWAIAHTVPCIQPVSLVEVPPELLTKKFDIFIIAAYGKLLRQNILSLPKKGCINLHPSLLPRFRGASPIESQILADEQPVGVSVMLMDEEMDHGPILAQEPAHVRSWPISKPALTELLAIQNGKLVAEILPRYVRGDITPQEQDHSQATYTKKIAKADGELELAAPARKNYMKYLAYEGWPGTFFFVQKGDSRIRVKIVKARYEAGAQNEGASATSGGTFTIERIIPEGKGEQDFSSFAASVGLR